VRHCIAVLPYITMSDTEPSSALQVSADAASAVASVADDESSARKSAKHDKSGADLDRVTDHFEEEDRSSAALTDSVQAMLGNSGAPKESATDKKCATVKVAQADVDFIVNELEVDAKVAERALQTSGDLTSALRSLVH
jgi:NACalpha-BTF3-like transcription factor